MRRGALLAGVLALALVLSACNGSRLAADNPEAGALDPGAEAASTEQAAGTGFRFSEGEVPLVTRLLIGTLNLEETDLAVGVEQAAELLPLWKAYLALTKSDITAEAELEAVANQIAEALTDEQMAAINDMGITPRNVGQILSEFAVEFGLELGGMVRRGEGGEFDLPEGFTPPEGFGRGQGRIFGEGGIPGGGPGMEGLEGIDPQMLATMQAQRGGRASGLGSNTVLIEVLIDLLEGKLETGTDG